MEVVEEPPATPAKESTPNPLDETIGELAPGVSRGDDGMLEGVAIGENFEGDTSDDDEEGEGIVIHAGKSTAVRRPHFNKYPGTYSGQKSYVRPQMTPGKDGVAANLMDKLSAADEELKKLRFSRHMTAFDVDINALDEHPWRNKNVDQFDYFNYGFNEKTWTVYCEKQLRIRAEKGLGPHHYVPAPVVPKTVPKIGSITIIDTTKPDAAPIVMAAVNGILPNIAPSNATAPPPPGAPRPPPVPNAGMPPPPPPPGNESFYAPPPPPSEYGGPPGQFYPPAPPMWPHDPNFAPNWPPVGEFVPPPPPSSTHESRGREYDDDRRRERDSKYKERDRERYDDSSRYDDRYSKSRGGEEEYGSSSKDYSSSRSSRDHKSSSEYESSSRRRSRRSRSRSNSEEKYSRDKRSRSRSKDRKSSRRRH